MDTGNAKLHFLDFSYSLLSSWRLIGMTVSIGVMFGLAMSFALPVDYTATAQVLPPQTEPSAASLLAGSLGSLGALGGGGGGGAGIGAALGLKNPADIYIGLLKSRSVADKLISKFNLQVVYRKHSLSQTRKQLARNTDFLVEKEGLISIAVTDHDRNRAAALANAYVGGLNSQDAQLAIVSASQRRQFFEGELGAEKTALADAETDLKRTEENSGLVQLDGQAQILLQRVAQLRAQIASHEVELQALADGETSRNPEYERVQTELKALQSELRQLQQPSTRRAPGSEPLEDFGTSSIPGVGLTYVRKLREVKYHETLLTLLARQYTTARMDEARLSPQVQVVDAAEPPDHKSGPPRALLLISFTVLGLLIGCMLVISRDMLTMAQSDPETRERIARIRNLFRRTPSHTHA